MCSHSLTKSRHQPPEPSYPISFFYCAFSLASAPRSHSFRSSACILEAPPIFPLLDLLAACLSSLSVSGVFGAEGARRERDVFAKRGATLPIEVLLLARLVLQVL